MSEPIRPIVVALPLEVYAGLAALAGEAPVEPLAVALLAEVVTHGSPGELRALLRLMTGVADEQAARWDARRERLARLRSRLERVAAELGQLVKEA